MKLIQSLLWPEPARSQGSKKAGIENHCHGSGFLSYVFWLVAASMHFTLLGSWDAASARAVTLTAGDGTRDARQKLGS